MPNVRVSLSQTQHDFAFSEAFENCLVGPRGEGKTEAGMVAMSIHAQRQDRSYRPIPWAIVRDTWKNLQRTTLQSFLNPRPGSFGASIRDKLRVKEGGKELELPGMWKIFMFGVDSPSDLNALLSLQLGGGWVEEAAPAAEETIGSGIAEDAYNVLASCLRHPVTTNRRLQITMNYPDEDHWTWKRFYDYGNENRVLFRIPRGENKHIDDQYRKNMERALQTRPDLLDRLVYGRPARVQVGEPVTPEYDEEIHRSRVAIDPRPDLVGFRFWDGYGNPVCMFAQLNPAGQLIILDTLIKPNSAVKQLIDDDVIPLMATKYVDVLHWRDIGDPTMCVKDQSDATSHAYQKIEEALFSEPGKPAIFEPGVSDWGDRREAMKVLLMRRVGHHEPALLLSRSEGVLHRALSGGWHYHKDTAGRVLRDKPVKDIHSHPGDAFSHAVPRLFPVVPEIHITEEMMRQQNDYNMFA